VNLRRYSWIALSCLVLVGCDADYERFGDLDPVAPRDPVAATEWLLDVNADGSSATYSEEVMPVGTAMAPSVVAARQIVRGGSLVMAVTVEDTADELFVSVRNADFGHFRVDLNALSAEVAELQTVRAEARASKLRSEGVAPRAAARAPREVWVNLTSAPDYTGTGFTIQLATGTGGEVSAPVNHVVSVNSTAAGSSRLQVSLNWVHPVDMDLHVRTPGGGQIYFAQKVGPQGGELDLDSNPACILDLVQNENITWRSTDPVAGEYIVLVHLWSACESQVNMPYVVTVRRGDVVSTFEGSFTPAEDGSTPREITRFVIE
jgi:hypothetical protein